MDLPRKEVVIKTFNDLFGEIKDFDKQVKEVIIAEETRVVNGVEQVADYVDDEKMYSTWSQIFAVIRRQFGKRFLRWEDEEFTNYLIDMLSNELPNLYAKQMLLVDNALSQLKGKNGVVNTTKGKVKSGKSSNPADTILGVEEDMNLAGAGVDEYNVAQSESENDLGIYNQAKLMAGAKIKNELYAMLTRLEGLFISKTNEEYLRSTYTPVLRFETYEEVVVRVLTKLGYSSKVYEELKETVGDLETDDPNKIFGDPRRNIIRQIILMVDEIEKNAEELISLTGLVEQYREVLEQHGIEIVRHTADISNLRDTKADKATTDQLQALIEQLSEQKGSKAELDLAKADIERLVNGKAEKNSVVALQDQLDAILSVIQKNRVVFNPVVPIVFDNNGDATIQWPAGHDWSGYTIGDEVLVGLGDTGAGTEVEMADQWNNGQPTEGAFFGDTSATIQTFADRVEIKGVQANERTNKVLRFVLNTSSATIDISTKANKDLGNVNVGAGKAGSWFKVGDDGTITWVQAYTKDEVIAELAKKVNGSDIQYQAGEVVITNVEKVAPSKFADTTLFDKYELPLGAALLGGNTKTLVNGEVISHTHTQANSKVLIGNNSYQSQGKGYVETAAEYAAGLAIVNNYNVDKGNSLVETLKGKNTKYIENGVINPTGGTGNKAYGLQIISHIYVAKKDITFAEMRVLNA